MSDKKYILTEEIDDFGNISYHDYDTFPVEIIGNAKTSLFPDQKRVFAEVIAENDNGYIVMVDEGFLGFLREDDCKPVNLHLENPKGRKN